MKRVLAICLIILFFCNTIVSGEMNRSELVDIANIMVANELQISGFEVTLKESMDRKQLESILDELQNSYTITTKENNNSIIYLVKNTHKTGNVYVNYNVIMPKNRNYQSELVVTITGENWNDTIKATYLETFRNIRNKYFTKDVKVFSCMSSISNDIIEFDEFIQKITEKFKLRHKKTLTDKLKTTNNLEIIYGYTSLWGQKITIQDAPVNLQVVAKNIGNGDVQYLIGTPILINEY